MSTRKDQQPGVIVNVDLVHRTVFQLNAICRNTTLQFALAVGALVVGSLYGGDVRHLRSRRRKEHAALRSVAADPALAMSASALYRSIAIFDVCERMGFRAWKHVSTTHIRVVLPLPPELQQQLLHETEANRWGVRELERRVAAMTDRLALRARGGRKRRTPLRTLVDGVQREAERVQAMLDGGPEALSESSPESVRGAVEALQRMRNLCSAMIDGVARASRHSGVRITDGLDSPGEELLGRPRG